LLLVAHSNPKTGGHPGLRRGMLFLNALYKKPGWPGGRPSGRTTKLCGWAGEGELRLVHGARLGRGITERPSAPAKQKLMPHQPLFQHFRDLLWHRPMASRLNGCRALECFQEKWIPVFRPETRQNNTLGSGFDSIKTGRTLKHQSAGCVIESDGQTGQGNGRGR